MAKLIVSESNGNLWEFTFTTPTIRIGRNPIKNDLVLPSRQVSSLHAQVEFTEGSYLLTDVGSTNGTFYDTQRIQTKWLSNGDRFRIGEYSLQLFTEGREQNVIYNEGPLSERLMTRSTSVFVNIREELNTQIKQAELEVKIAQKVKILEHLFAFGQMLSSTFDLDKIFAQIAEIVFKLTPAERCAVLLWERQSDKLEPRHISFRSPLNLGETAFNISRTITKKVLNEGIAIISENLQQDKRFNSVDSIAVQSIRSVMCVPLIGKKNMFGVIYADKLGVAAPFSEDDADLLNAIAAQTAIAVDNALTYDRLAQEAVTRAFYQRFLVNQLADLMINSPEQLKIGEGITQPVSILFADIRNFTAMTEQGEPQSIIHILNRFFSAMTDIIFAYSGTLDKFIGDGVMALFGAPYQGNNDPHNAVAAAIAMQRRLSLLNQELVSGGFHPLTIGIGIDTGEVTVGFIGSEMRMDYTAIGSPVNLAARLMQQAKGGQILISGATNQHLSNAFPTHRINNIELRGITQVPDIFEVVY
jgi:adenylate cyclase